MADKVLTDMPTATEKHGEMKMKDQVENRDQEIAWSQDFNAVIIR